MQKKGTKSKKREGERKRRGKGGIPKSPKKARTRRTVFFVRTGQKLPGLDIRFACGPLARKRRDISLLIGLDHRNRTSSANTDNHTRCEVSREHPDSSLTVRARGGKKLKLIEAGVILPSAFFVCHPSPFSFPPLFLFVRVCCYFHFG